MIEGVATMAAGALALTAAIFHAALHFASPARLEEINDRAAHHRSLPDLEDAAAAAAAVKIILYAFLAFTITLWAVERFPASPSRYVWGGLASITGVAVVEVLALFLAGRHSGRGLYRLIGLVGSFAAVGSVLLGVGLGISGFLAKLSGRAEPVPPEEAADQEMLDALSEGEREGVIHDQEREMIESIIEFKDVEVSEVMTPRTQLTTVNAEKTLRETLGTIIDSGHSRLPVWWDNTDNVVGVLYVKDILKCVERGLDAPVRSLMREPHFVPETKMVRELLQEFRKAAVHMAIVLDEYGGTSGVVSIEDILEEIVGEIEDEYDEAEPPDVQKTGPREAVVAGDAPVDEVNEELGIRISEDEEYETVAGYVLFRTGRIPSSGEVFEWENLRFRVLEADERKIEHLSIEILEPDMPYPNRRGG